MDAEYGHIASEDAMDVEYGDITSKEAVEFCLQDAGKARQDTLALLQVRLSLPYI